MASKRREVAAQRLTREWQREFDRYVRMFELQRLRTEERAGSFVALYEELRAIRGGVLTWVEFVRLLVPDLPLSSVGPESYKTHPAYNASLYLLRVWRHGQRVR